jgi:hypothetical protein
MCFSPQADFTAGVVVAGVGVATLRRVRTGRQLIIGALPLLLALHQGTEGFVWLGLEGKVSPGVGDTARTVYVIFAHAGLPALVPVGFALLEPDRRRSRAMWPLAGIGLCLGAYMLWQVTAYPIGAHTEARCIDYTTHAPNDILIGVLYVAVTCGPALLSSRPHLRWFGLVSAVGAIAVALVRVDELTSLWCLYVALVSVLILLHFRRDGPEPAGAAGTPIPS